MPAPQPHTNQLFYRVNFSYMVQFLEISFIINFNFFLQFYLKPFPLMCHLT